MEWFNLGLVAADDSRGFLWIRLSDSWDQRREFNCPLAPVCLRGIPDCDEFYGEQEI
jgi:hypothetical protein